jgi:disulfide bond formation protein DsbB
VTRSQTLAALLVGACGGMLGVALFMEHIVGLAPCPLCVMQRIWMAFAGLIALAGLAHNPRILIYPVLTIAAVATGAGFSVRQLYLQSLPPDQVPACGPDLAYMLDAFPLRDLLREMTFGSGNCAEVSASLMGISIPGWTLVGFVGLAALAVLQIRAARM